MLAPENEDDLGMQIGWNQLFQQFVSDLFVDTEERDAPVVTIDNLDANGRTISSVLPSLRQAVDFVRTKYARRFSPYVTPSSPLELCHLLTSNSPAHNCPKPATCLSWQKVCPCT